MLPLPVYLNCIYSAGLWKNEEAKMPVHLDPKEILEYLNELGYYNVSATQLKEFMRDLKKLIKYEDRRALHENQENIPKDYTDYFARQNFYQSVPQREVLNEIPSKEKLPSCTTDTFSSLHTASTISSRAKSVPKKGSVISIEVSKPKKQIYSQSEISDQVSVPEPKMYPTSCSLTTNSNGYVTDYVSVNTLDNPTRSSVYPCRQAGRNIPITTKSEGSLTRPSSSIKPKVSFIRPRKPAQKSKSDPVSLYHRYQEEWKKQKLPGEDRRYDLRWAIRERMLGEPDIQPISAKASTYAIPRRHISRL